MLIHAHTPHTVPAEFKRLGIEYLPRPRIAYRPLLGFDPLTAPYYIENREEMDLLASRYGDEIRAARIGPVFIGPTDNMGLGLFALRALEKGEFIGEYTGIVRETAAEPIPDFTEPPDRYDVPLPDLTVGALSGLPSDRIDSDSGLVLPASVPGSGSDYAWNYPECFPDVELELDGGSAGNEMRFVNHSFHPNLAVEHAVVDGRWAVFYIADRDIAESEQLFVNYGDEYWDGRYRSLVLEWDPPS